MSRDNDADIKKIGDLRQRVKSAQSNATAAQVRYEQAQEDLEKAKQIARSLGIDPDDQRAFERWLDEEAAAIEALIAKAETNLRRAQETIDGR